VIKALGVHEGKPLLVVGLSGENITRLAAGEPIYFNGAEVGMASLNVLIAYGRTEQDILDEVNAVGPGSGLAKIVAAGVAARDAERARWVEQAAQQAG
jgi:hypothetical protein